MPSRRLLFRWPPPRMQAFPQVLTDLANQGHVQEFRVRFSALPGTAVILLPAESAAEAEVRAALASLGLAACAGTERKLQALLASAEQRALQDLAAVVLSARNVADLASVDCEPLVQTLAASPLVNVANQLAACRELLGSLVQSTAPGMIKALLSQALLTMSQAQADWAEICQSASLVSSPVLEAIIKHWRAIVGAAFALLPKEGDPDWRDKLAQLDREQLRRRAAPAASANDEGGSHEA